MHKLIYTAVGLFLLCCDSYVGADTVVTAPSPSDAMTTLHLQLGAEPGSAVKTVPVQVGESAEEILERCKPAPAAADDDPWVAYPAQGNGSYYLFFGSPSYKKSNLKTDKLDTVIHYSGPDQTSGVVLLPAQIRGRRCGRFAVLNVPLGPSAIRIAVVAQGMTLSDIRFQLFPAKTLPKAIPEVAYLGPLDGKYVLEFKVPPGQPAASKQTQLFAARYHAPDNRVIRELILPSDGSPR